MLELEKGKAHHVAIFDDKVPRELPRSPVGHSIFVNYKGPSFAHRQGRNVFFHGKIGFLSSTGREFAAITRDTSSYATCSISADGRSLATVQTKTDSNAFLLPAAGTESTQVEPLPLAMRDGADAWKFGGAGACGCALLCRLIKPCRLLTASREAFKANPWWARTI